MMWPMAHMVAPVERALGCKDCHDQLGRMAGVEGMYVPGRGRWPWLDWLGFGLVFLTLVGMVGHGVLRFVFHVRERGNPEGRA